MVRGHQYRYSGGGTHPVLLPIFPFLLVLLIPFCPNPAQTTPGTHTNRVWLPVGGGAGEVSLSFVFRGGGYLVTNTVNRCCVEYQHGCCHPARGSYVSGVSSPSGSSY